MAENEAIPERRQRWRPSIHWHIGRDLTLLLLCAFAAVGAVVGASTGIAAVRQVTSISGDLNNLLDGSAAASAEAADANPDNLHLTLASEDRQDYVDLVIGASEEEGWVLSSNLPPAREGRRYLLWAETGSGTILLGSAGQEVGPRYFTVPVGASAIFITEEPATGAIQPSGQSLARAELP